MKSVFPNPAEMEAHQDIIARGGDISPQMLSDAYFHGIFPWYNPGEEILWWCPNGRFVLFPDELKISTSMRKILSRNEFTVTENQEFEQVMNACMVKKRANQDGTWITEELISSMNSLHKNGIAKSVEAYHDGKLSGGLYGLEIGDIFCGESMFSNVSNASKAAFISFIQNNKDKYKLIDCQVYSEHLESLGARMISRKEFLSYLV